MTGAERLQLLAADICPECRNSLRQNTLDGRVGSRLTGIEYSYGSPNHYDGVSEWRCPDCGSRFGRWTGNVLNAGESEPRYGRTA